jgi:hypothetical protein
MCGITYERGRISSRNGGLWVGAVCGYDEHCAFTWEGCHHQLPWIRCRRMVDDSALP